MPTPLITSRGLRAGLLALALGLGACGGSSGGGGRTVSAARLTVLAGGLANPRGLSVGADGALYVAEAGNGGTTKCTTLAGTGQRICLGLTGSIARVAGGTAVPVVRGLPSIASVGGASSSGPAGVVATTRGLAFLVQNTRIDARGANPFGQVGRPLGRLGFATTGGVRLSADFARYEVLHDPDHGAGAVGAGRHESDPYAAVAYRGGYAVVDAAANDLLWVDGAGKIHLLAVFPTQTVTLAGKPVVAQSVPTAVAVGPDAALYVGELTGSPFAAGSARIWRVAPGRAPTVWAGGFTTISALAFDRSGRMLVLEIDRLGLGDTSGAPGELIRVEADRRRSVLARAGLVYPTGVAVGADGSIYVANYGESPSTGAGPHGEVVRIAGT